MKIRFVFIFLLSLIMQWGTLQAQSSQLAIQYYQKGEYEKAATLFSSILERNQNNTYYWEKYIDCLIKLGKHEKAIGELKTRLEKNSDPGLYVALGQVYDLTGDPDKAGNSYQKAIDNLPPNKAQIYNLAQAFQRQELIDQAIQTYEKGSDLLNDKYVFAYNLGGLYQNMGDIPKMIEYFLLSLEADPNRLENVQLLFQRYLKEKEDFIHLQHQVFQAIQEGNEKDHYNELLAWAFIQGKNYSGALRQLTALDRRNNENGRRVYNIAQTAENDQAYDVAINAYNYIIEEKGPSSPYYFAAKQQILNVKLEQITSGSDYSKDELLALDQDYESFLDEQGRTGRTASIMADQAQLAAIYLNDMDKAVSILEQLKESPGVNDLIQARAKLKLGDYYLIQGKKWEATLLYSQVDKAFPEAEIGELARFRNAMLSYYFGDFEWAQEQFDILKAATSRLISNDAIDRSVFIMDNLNLDTTAHPISLYADAELLAFQNKYTEAFNKLDSIELIYSDHGLIDDILFLKGQIAEKRKNFDKSRTYYAKIVSDFPEEIRADNALYNWAQLEENHFKNLSEAQKLYEQLFLEYPGSTLATDSRKRYRLLRGDKIQ